MASPRRSGAATLAMDGNESSLRDLGVYDSVSESCSTKIAGRGVRSQYDRLAKPYRIMGKGYKKKDLGGDVQNLIRGFEDRSTTYDPGDSLTNLQVRAMSSTDGGGDQGDASEASAHPKPSASLARS